MKYYPFIGGYAFNCMLYDEQKKTDIIWRGKFPMFEVLTLAIVDVEAIEVFELRSIRGLRFILALSLFKLNF